ncbi:MAG: YgiT-type zinc finger protein [Elusimicrobia bacterium]|nr:YgiT-type zinc finger protein [Elusimicrobiota bacterium]
MNLLFKKCPVCAEGRLQIKKVEKLLHGGVHTAVVKVSAEVCTHCGERLYPPDVITRFETIRSRLKQDKLSGFRITGKTVVVA